VLRGGAAVGVGLATDRSPVQFAVEVSNLWDFFTGQMGPLGFPWEWEWSFGIVKNGNVHCSKKFPRDRVRRRRMLCSIIGLLVACLYCCDEISKLFKLFNDPEDKLRPYAWSLNYFTLCYVHIWSRNICIGLFILLRTGTGGNFYGNGNRFLNQLGIRI